MLGDLGLARVNSACVRLSFDAQVQRSVGLTPWWLNVKDRCNRLPTARDYCFKEL